jgi:hypothetical protein
MDFREIIKDFGSRHGLPHLDLDEKGCCALGGESLMFGLTYTESAGQVRFEALVGFLPMEESEAERSRQKLLEMSLLGDGTAGGAAALDETGEGVLLVHHASPVGWSVEDLERLMAALVDAALRLREEANLELAG